MKIGAIIGIILLFAIGGSMAAYHFSDEQKAKRLLIAAFEQMQDTATTQDTPKLMTEINTYFSPTAQTSLKVTFSIFGIGENRGGRSVDFEFASNKDFANFIQEMINQVNSYGMQFDVKGVALDEADSSSVSATIHASGFAKTKGMMANRAVDKRFVIAGDCQMKGTVGKSLLINSFDCPVKLRQQVDLQGTDLRNNIQELKGVRP